MRREGQRRKWIEREGGGVLGWGVKKFGRGKGDGKERGREGDKRES